MTPSEFHLGFERKIGYSFLGLLAGNAVVLAGLLFIAFFRDYPFLAKLRHPFYLNPKQALFTFLWFAIFSVVGWVIVGIPAVLLMPANLVSRLHWLLAVPIGAVLGVFALYLELDRGHLPTDALRDPTMYWQIVVCVSAAALNSGVAFAVYCTLLQWARLSEETRNGAPRGTPQFFSVLD
jgi:hypothetical protein